MKVPFYSLKDFQEKISTHYNIQDKTDWVDIKFFLEILNNDFIKKFEKLDLRNIGNFLSEREYYNAHIKKNGKTINTYKNIIIALKMLFPTLRTSEQFNRNIGEGLSHGIQINLPQGAIIKSFCKGEIIKTGVRKGSEKGIGSYVMIKDNKGNIWIYGNLETINVDKGDKIGKFQKIGTAGISGGGYFPGVYIQIDKEIAGISPYTNTNIKYIKRYTLNPLDEIKKAYKIKEKTTEEVFKSNFYIRPGYPKIMPKDIKISNKEAFQAISSLYGIGAINLYKENFNPEKPMKKSQFSSIVERLRIKGLINSNYEIKKSNRNLTKNELKNIIQSLEEKNISKHISQISNETISKEQAAFILWKIIENKLEKYDVRI